MTKESALQAEIHPSSDVLEGQLRECFGRVVYAHKTHEKCADLAQRRLAHIKLWQIALSAITTGGLIAIVMGPADASRLAAGIAALVSSALLALNAYTKEHDLGKVAQQHKDAADRLWAIRETYLSLLTDLRARVLGSEAVRLRRDALQADLAAVYASAPRTSPAGYAAASKALKVKEDLTFSDEEIDQFLPRALKRHPR
jgi:hypothetical protein